MTWQHAHQHRLASADEAVARIEPGGTVFIGSACAEPTLLVQALLGQRQRLAGTTLLHTLTLDPSPYLAEEYAPYFQLLTPVGTGGSSRAWQRGQADYLPVRFSALGAVLRERRPALRAALIQVSPPDRQGYCSLGLTADWVRTAIEAADLVLAEVNQLTPRTPGRAWAHLREFDAIVESSVPPRQVPPAPIGETARRIGEHIAALVPDRAILQVGIGSIPDAALLAMCHHRELAVHSGLIGDRVVDLLEAGALRPRQTAPSGAAVVATMIIGTDRLYRAVHDNPDFALYPASYTHDARVLAALPGLIAINSARQVDLTGQVNAESDGPIPVSGVGGQADFARGAALSAGGLSILALPSTAAAGKISRIVPHLPEGAAVTVPRYDVQVVVTEYGAADLRGKPLPQRARALVDIAHPDFRQALEVAAESGRS